MAFERITINPKQMGGVPCVRGMRMPVTTIVRMLGSGWTQEEILRDWPELQPEDIQEALLFAAETANIRYQPLQ